MFLSERVEVGLTLNVLEALSVGLPVLLSSHLCLIDSESLFPVQPQDEKAVACCLENILIKTQQRKLVSALPTEYSLDYSANAYLNLFETLKLPVPVIEGS
jgi:glycosyltransferase involved in cell wall biosynthesis